MNRIEVGAEEGQAVDLILALGAGGRGQGLGVPPLLCQAPHPSLLLVSGSRKLRCH